MSETSQRIDPGGQPTENFGSIAIKLGFITKSQLEDAVRIQSEAAKAGLRKRLGEVLIESGFLSQEQMARILKNQVARKRIGDFELISKLGSGGMGSVFRARQVTMDRVVALKILSPKLAKDASARERFVREARSVAKLNHPHIVAGIDVGCVDGFWYFAMEYVDGESLGQCMKRVGALPEQEALEFTYQVARALQHAHQNGLLHRDVKPDNVLLDRDHKIAKLADLGLARQSDACDGAITMPGEAVGTPFYISPEQAEGRHDLTPATDLYSLGASLFHMLTGRVPFDGSSAAVIMTMHLTEPAPSVRALKPEISAGAEALVMRLMQKRPEDRYPDAISLIHDIERVQAGESLMRKGRAASARAYSAPTTVERENKPSHTAIPTRGVRRRQARSDFSLGGVLIILLALGALLLLVNPFSSRETGAQRTASGKPADDAAGTPDDAGDEVQAAAIPALPRLQPDGTRIFKADFESGRCENFDIDPLVSRHGQCLRVIADAAGNHVLRLARIRSTEYLARESGCMARLVFPRDLPISRQTTFSFVVHFEKYAAKNPELRVWCYLPQREPGVVNGWIFKDPTFSSGWGKVLITLGQEQIKQKSNEPADVLPFIAIYAGRPEEKLDVFIDDVEFISPPETRTATREAAPKAKSLEAPVAPRPKKTLETPPAVAPAPAPKKPDLGNFGGAL